jgi:Tfp pilus assembly protein PilN
LLQVLLKGMLPPLRPALIRSAMPLAATLLVALILSFANRYEQGAVNDMQIELDRLATAERKASEFKLQILAADAKRTQLASLASGLGHELGAKALRSLAACMPDDVWLTRVELEDSAKVRLQGASYLEAGVYDFVRWLEQAPGFAEVALRGTSPTLSDTGLTTSFELELTLGESNDQVTKVARHE